MYGYSSDQLSKREQEFFLASLEGYRTGRVPSIACTQLIREYGIRFGDTYIRDNS